MVQVVLLMKISESLATIAKCKCNTELRALAKRAERLESVVEQLETSARAALETLGEMGRLGPEPCPIETELSEALDALYEFAGEIETQ
jgi:hypothetical protein